MSRAHTDRHRVQMNPHFIYILEPAALIGSRTQRTRRNGRLGIAQPRSGEAVVEAAEVGPERGRPDFQLITRIYYQTDSPSDASPHDASFPSSARSRARPASYGAQSVHHPASGCLDADSRSDGFPGCGSRQDRPTVCYSAEDVHAQRGSSIRARTEQRKYSDRSGRPECFNAGP